MHRLALLLLLPLAASAGELLEERNPATGLSSWTYSDNGFSLQFIPLTREFVKAVYASRGLSQAVVDSLADYCVFGTIIRNDTPQRLSYNVADWRYVTAGAPPRTPRAKNAWVQEWRSLGSNFQWLMLPDEQSFEPGDWSQGFTTVELKPGTVFDLDVHWSSGHEQHQYRFKNLACAPEKTPAAGTAP